MKVYLITDGDLFDYDAPAPSAIFLTKQEAWKFISDGVTFREYDNGQIMAFTDHFYIYEFPVGEQVHYKKNVNVLWKGQGSWCNITEEMGKHWRL